MHYQDYKTLFTSRFLLEISIINVKFQLTLGQVQNLTEAKITCITCTLFCQIPAATMTMLSSAYINQLCTVAFCDVWCLFIIWWLNVLQFTNEEMYFEEQRSEPDLKTSIAWNVQSNFSQGIYLPSSKNFSFHDLKKILLLMFIITEHHHQTLCSSKSITVIYLTCSNTCNAEQKQSYWFTSKFIKICKYYCQ